MKLCEIFQTIDEHRELLFELRNVMNVGELKGWSKEASKQLAHPFLFIQHDEIYAMVQQWGEKALLKHAVKNMHGTKVKYYKEYPEFYHVGPHRYQFDTLPTWAQEALLRGDELEVVQPWVTSIAHGDIERDIRLVRDFLRNKFQQDPRSFTPARLSRINWPEAMRLTQEYHAELERKRPRSINEMLDWYRGNPDAVEQAVSIMPPGRYAEIFKNSLAVKGDYTYKDMVETFGVGIFDKIAKIFKKATGLSVELPKDDPKGREDYIRYDDKGAILPPQPAAEPDPHLRMDWPDTDQDGALEPSDEDFEPAPEMGEGWYKLNTTACVEYEGAMMGHCVGGYGSQVESGDVEIYSLRDENNEPHTTIEVSPHAHDYIGATLEQIKGKGNRPPVLKYREKVIDFLRKLYLESDNDIDIADEAIIDLMGISIIPADSPSSELQIIDPPFDPYGFRYSLNVNYYEEDPETGEVDLSNYEEKKFKDGLSLLEALELADMDESDMEDMLYFFMDGNRIWYSDPEDYDEEEQHVHIIDYRTEEEHGFKLQPRKISRTIGEKWSKK